MQPCPFCSVGRDRVVTESESAIAVPDAYPVAEGHTLVVPRRHVHSIYEMSSQEQSLIWAMVAKVWEMLILRLNPDARAKSPR